MTTRFRSLFGLCGAMLMLAPFSLLAGCGSKKDDAATDDTKSNAPASKPGKLGRKADPSMKDSEDK